MPQLDVSFVVNDPMFADTFSVTRRTETIGDDGRATLGTELHPRQIGVVLPQDPADLVRRDDGQMVPRVIEVHSRFKLRAAALGFQPDVVAWGGTKYLVTRIYPFSHFGHGHTRALAESVTPTDPVPQ